VEGIDRFRESEKTIDIRFYLERPLENSGGLFFAVTLSRPPSPTKMIFKRKTKKRKRKD